jgi:PAS domain S-box-containing protein
MAASAYLAFLDLAAGILLAWPRGIPAHAKSAPEFPDQRWLARIAELTIANGELHRELIARRQAERELRQGECRYRSLVEATTAIVWNTPASGELESEQPGWSDFTGQDFDQLKGWGWLNAIHPDDRAHTASVWSAAVASRTLYQVEHRIRRHDGEYRHMIVRAVPIFAEDRSISEWVGVHTDIEEQKRAQEVLRLGKEAAESATRAKSEFLANMSHEIRTPMNGILGMTELALDTELTAQQREYLGLVKSSGDALLVVLNDILDFSKIEAGKLDLDPMPFGLRDCVEGTLKILAARAHGKGLELSCRIAPDVPDNLVADSGRLQQILVNLVGNAIKFTERGEVIVSVECSASACDSDELALQISVRDTGIGIPAHKQQTVLEAFTQADGSTTRRFGGTGLGLAISCKLVELMGGRLWLESEPGNGSTFHFSVPLRRDAETRPGQPTIDPERLFDLPVLVVDDNLANRRILEEVLASWGAKPTSIDNGPGALNALREAHASGQPFAVALLDVMMPDMDGYAVAQQIAADPRLSNTVVVMLTSVDGSDNLARRKALRIGAALTKPVRQSELFGTLMQLLHCEARQSAPIANARNAAPHVNPAERPLNILLADDQVVNQKVVTNMLTKRGHRVTIASNGREACEAAMRANFDVALMDVQMPEMDGFEALTAIRQDEQSTGRHLPIIALTAHAMKGDRERCLDSGFDSYLSKPVRSDQLYGALDALTTSSFLGAAAGEDNATLRAADHKVPDYEEAIGRPR